MAYLLHYYASRHPHISEAVVNKSVCRLPTAWLLAYVHVKRGGLYQLICSKIKTVVKLEWQQKFLFMHFLKVLRIFQFCILLNFLRISKIFTKDEIKIWMKFLRYRKSFDEIFLILGNINQHLQNNILLTLNSSTKLVYQTCLQNSATKLV